MCTAISYLAGDHYFGRNLDLDYSYHETVTITPRNYPFHFRNAQSVFKHPAIIGMAYVLDDYPLYYDATNEHGLSIAGLHFPQNASYVELEKGDIPIAPFELVPWVLSQCSNVHAACILLKKTTLVKEDYSPKLPAAPLHWLISDSSASITAEQTEEGMKLYENHVGVLTNNPPFYYHMLHLSEYMAVTSSLPVNHFASSLEIKPYSLGMGSIGLPGDMSSASRFIRAAFVKCNSFPAKTEKQNISQFFHILDSVAQPKGCTLVRPGEYEFTLYSSCCNTSKGIYYYKTYENSQISGVSLNAENLDSNKLINYELEKEQRLYMQN